MVALALNALLSAVAVASDISYHDLVRRVLSGNFVSLSTATSADDRVTTIARTEIGLYIVAGLLFIAWFRLAYKNVARLGVAGTRWSSAWAVGAWFVPILNLVRPKMMMNDIWRGSDPSLRVGSMLGKGGPPLLYQVWWGVWILGWIADRLTYTNFGNAQTPSELSSATVALTVSDLVDLIGAVLAIAVVYSLTSRQRKRADAVAAIDPSVEALPALGEATQAAPVSATPAADEPPFWPPPADWRSDRDSEA
jgi:hypothetical protein